MSKSQGIPWVLQEPRFYKILKMQNEKENPNNNGQYSHWRLLLYDNNEWNMNWMKLTQYEPKMVNSYVVKFSEPLCLGLKA